MKDHLQALVRSRPDAAEGFNLAREYLQARILQGLQKQGMFMHWAFLGGTALRFLYAIPRYSEDLDFSLIPRSETPAFNDAMGQIKAGFEAEGYRTELKLNDKKTVHSGFVRFPGLLYELGLSARPAQTIAIKFDVDTNPPAGGIVATSIVRRHVTLNLTHYDPASLLAGKLHAVLSRSWAKGRDLYDLIWYLSDRAWPGPNLKLLNNALAQSQPSSTSPVVLTAQSWREAVLQRLERVNWNEAIADVEPFLEHQHEVNLLTLENCRKLLLQR